MNNLMLRENISIWSKIKSFFQKITNSKKTDKIRMNLYPELNSKSTAEKNTSFVEKVRGKENLEDNKILLTTEIISMVESDPDLLETLTLDKLEIISEYYDKKLTALDKEIQRLKKF